MKSSRAPELLADEGAGHDDTFALLSMRCDPALSSASAIALTLRGAGDSARPKSLRLTLAPP
jgi:predicted RNA polymerase sigma factor